jgi:hypothetical protein
MRTKREDYGDLPYLPKQAVVYDLSDLHLPWKSLKCDPETGIIISISDATDDPSRHAIMARYLGPREWRLCMPILYSYPQYCPYAVTYAAFYSNGDLTRRLIDNAQTAIEQARDVKQLDGLLADMRNAVSRVRAKFKPFGLNFLSLNQGGFMLDAIGQQRVLWTDARDTRRSQRLVAIS